MEHSTYPSPSLSYSLIGTRCVSIEYSVRVPFAISGMSVDQIIHFPVH